MNGNFKRNLLINSGVSLLILIVSSAASFISISSLLDSNRWVNHTQDVIYNINMSKSVIVDAQTAMRGYLLTGNINFLAPYKDSEKVSGLYIDEITFLSVDNPKQQSLINELKPLKATFFNYLDERIKEKQDNNLYSGDDIARGKMMMDSIRDIFTRMEDEEQRLLDIRTSISEKYGIYSSVLIVIAALLSLLISVIFFRRILKDYNERVKLQRELEKNEKETAQRISVISNIALQISKGNYDIRVQESESDALGSVAGSLNNMAGSLSKSFTTLSDNEWLQHGIAGLNNVMIGEKNLEVLTKDIIQYVALYTDSSAGVIYLQEGEDLQLYAGYSYNKDVSRNNFKVGEGLTGQAALSGKLLELKEVSASDIKISYAMGEIKPAHIVSFPLISSKSAGVIEIASVRIYTKREIEYLNAISQNIAIAIIAAQSRKKVQELLTETQAQSEELQVQHSELEGMNAELEAQTEKLQASEEELRVQQEELQQTNEELAERSVLLEEKNVEIQKKSEDLELTTRYKSEFLANMSHELRTPLNSILLLSRLLSENTDANMNDEQMEFARVINSSGNGLLALIDEILDLSKIEAGKMDLELLDVATGEIATGMKNMFSEIAREKNIDFQIITSEAPLVIKTDKMRLEQILKNLLSNAIKFTEKGSVSLEIKNHPANTRMISFIVKDTGIGIPREKQPLIFEAFQQADGSTKRKYGGTGLGLSISRELAKLLNGEITLKSIDGEGSEFTLSIPILGAVKYYAPEKPVVSRVDARENMPKAETEEELTPYQYLSPSIPDDVPDDRDDILENDKVILIVEDDINFAKSLLTFTRKRGYKGIVSVRGDYALNLAIAFKPAGILLDIQLPMKSGWEVMDELKDNPQTKHIPVHIMSSHKLKQESLLKGAVNFLDKPVAFELIPEIFKKIEHVINRESQKVLIFEDNAMHARALANFLENYNISAEINSEIVDGIKSLKKEEVDCVILDMGIPDKQAYEILENVKKNPGLENLPVIVFTGKSLSMKEELKIKKYADSIVIKTAHSYQRMLDEVSLFLHLVEDKKEGKKDNFKKINQLNNVLNNKTVLVVDDDVRNIFSLTKAIEALKMQVLTAIDGKEALKMLEQHPEIDVVLLDMMMPNMDGYETATRIRQDYKLKNLPVIAVTAKAMTGDREKCINAGASDYITKPVDVDQLMSLLRVWLYDKN